MKSEVFAYHGVLAPLEDACRLSHADILCVSDLMQTGSAIDALSRKLGIVLRHCRLVWTVFMNRERSFILVRDFSNIPLVCVFPAIRWMNARMLFVVNHNLQWTRGNRIERAAFRRLGRWGCRFVFFEQVPVDLLKIYGIDPLRCFALPLPTSETAFKRDRPGGVKTVGIVGQFRVEKGVDELLDILLPVASKYHVVLGLPNRGEFRHLSRHADGDWFDVVDTASGEGYRKAIMECDVVLLNHPASGYEYRASGLIADAATAHVPVVVCNLPMLRHQVSQPACVGECFDALADIPDCIERISVRLARGEYDFVAYNTGRSTQGVANRLDRICTAK
jgi:glycosyltransferase involved in cell wall biosynthesis